MYQHRGQSGQFTGHVKQGDHLCIICRGREESAEIVARYIMQGLRNNEFVTYASGAENRCKLLKVLAYHNVHVEQAIDDGALSLPLLYESYVRGDKLNAGIVYDAVDRAITGAEGAGFAGSRFVCEPIWGGRQQDEQPDLIALEAGLDQLFRNRRASGLCVYDQQTWSPEIMREILHVHSTVVVDDLLCTDNPYYKHSTLFEEKVGQNGSTKARVDGMLEQVRDSSAQDARLQLALDAGHLGSWELDLETDTSVRSRRHDQIFGYEDLLPDWGYDIFIEHVLPEDRGHVDRAFECALRRGSTWSFECRIRCKKDGAIRWIEANGRPYPVGSRGEQVERLLGIVADITERKELEQALRDADRRKDEFLATLAHELRNPLAPILNVLHLMERKKAEDPELKQMQGVIDRQARHLVRLVDDLLDVSRITRGQITLQQERVDLRAVLSSAIEASRPLIDSLGHSLSVDLPAEPIFLEADATRLTQVFLNLLNNAANYTPDPGHIELSAERTVDQVVVRITDNGIGILPEQISDIFQMFTRGERLGERSQDGLGVGLALAKQLLELHGGTVTAHSAGLGRGSEFVVWLPVYEANLERHDDHPDSDIADAQGDERILVVDDNIDAADSLAASFELLGHSVNTRYNGLAAVKATAEFDPDIIVLDIGLPDIDGYEAARRIRALKPEVTLIALTGWGQEKDQQLAREAGFDLHQTKPIRPSEFLTVITGLAADKRARANDL